MLRKIFIGAVVLLFSTTICFAEGPSFDCKKAKTWVEKRICKDEELSRLDKGMSGAYEELLSKLQGDDKTQVKQNQVQWIKERDKICGDDQPGRQTYVSCSDIYSERLEELKEWEQYVKDKEKVRPTPWQAKCWKRIKPFEGTGNASICRAFETLLNTTCEPPEKLQCNWTLPEGEKRFKKLTWTPLDWRTYWELIGELRVSGVRENLREGLWKKEESRILKLFEEGKRSIAITTVDVDNDGNKEQLVRYNLIPCSETPGVMFGIMLPETKRLDWRYKHTFGVNYLKEGAEIMLFDGKAFMFGWDYGWKIVMIYDTSLNICQFKYIKGGIKQ